MKQPPSLRNNRGVGLSIPEFGSDPFFPFLWERPEPMRVAGEVLGAPEVAAGSVEAASVSEASVGAASASADRAKRKGDDPPRLVAPAKPGGAPEGLVEAAFAGAVPGRLQLQLK